MTTADYLFQKNEGFRMSLKLPLTSSLALMLLLFCAVGW